MLLSYSFIRRYGKRTNVFIIEAGRSCETGEGEFRFHSQDAEKMFILFRSTTEEILNKQTNLGPEVPPPSETIPEPQPVPPPKDGITQNKANESSDEHIYSQVQKKRAAPNPAPNSTNVPSIPPRGPSVRKTQPPPVPPPVALNNGESANRREPVYAELLVTNETSRYSRRDSKEKAVTRTRARSPAPLTDNFIRMDGVTQYASVVDFIPPQKSTALSANSNNESSHEIASAKNNGVDMNMISHHHSQQQQYQHQLQQQQQQQQPVGKQVQSKKSKQKSNKKSPNDENRSWFHFFAGSSKKTASS